MMRKRALASLRAFIPDEPIAKIAELCMLEPIDSWRLWTDNLGHKMTISKNRGVILHKYKELNPKIKDIYYKSTPRQLLNISKSALIVYAQSIEEQIANIAFMLMCGNDDVLRLACLVKNEWIENQPPLSCGLKSLKVMSNNLYIADYKQIQVTSISCPLNCFAVNAWATPLPINSKLKLELLLANKLLASDILKTI